MGSRVAHPTELFILGPVREAIRIPRLRAGYRSIQEPRCVVVRENYLALIWVASDDSGSEFGSK